MGGYRCLWPKKKVFSVLFIRGWEVLKRDGEEFGVLEVASMKCWSLKKEMEEEEQEGCGISWSSLT